MMTNAKNIYAPELYEKMRINGLYLYIGHQNCKIYDVFDLKPCLKYAAYGHPEKKHSLVLCVAQKLNMEHVC